MPNPRVNYELVKVIDRARLLSPEQIEYRYRTATGRALARGIYAVLWPLDASTHRYDASAQYHGPFPSWRTAHEFVDSSLVPRADRLAPDTGMR